MKTRRENHKNMAQLKSDTEAAKVMNQKEAREVKEV